MYKRTCYIPKWLVGIHYIIVDLEKYLEIVKFFLISRYE